MLENSLWIWFGNLKEPFYMPWDYQFLPVVRSSSCNYSVGILYSFVLCVFSVFQFGCLFVLSGVNPAGTLCVSVKRSFNIRFMLVVYVQVPSTDWTTYDPCTSNEWIANNNRRCTGQNGHARTTNGYSWSLQYVSIFVHAQNFRTDADGETAYHRTWNECSGHRTDIKRIFTNITG